MNQKWPYLEFVGILNVPQPELVNYFLQFSLNRVQIAGDPIRALKTLDNTRLMFVIKGASTTEKLCELFAFWGWIHPICKKERPFF